MDADRFRETLAHWASGVVIAAVRDDGRVLATTVTAFLSVSLEPPLVLISLGPSAQVLPFLPLGARFGLSILGGGQSRVASAFADSFPVGVAPFAEGGVPLVADALAHLVCSVERLEEAGDHRLVIARVEEASAGSGDPLVRYDRAYHRLRAGR
jgi:flavin reductase (DIM6/NTAB) family NADH-FMN oxidoreductase RutF